MYQASPHKKMKILLPTFAHEWEDPYEKLFIAFMYRIGVKHGFDIQYTIWPRDVRIITQAYYILPQNKFEKGWHHYLFGYVNQFTWIFRWKREPKAKLWEVTDERALHIWYHLLQKESYEPLVEDKYHGWNINNYESSLTREMAASFKYLGGKDTRDQRVNKE